jgi:hypothetical protein
MTARKASVAVAALAVALLLAATTATAERPEEPPGQSRQGEPGPTHGPREDHGGGNGGQGGGQGADATPPGQGNGNGNGADGSNHAPPAQGPDHDGQPSPGAEAHQSPAPQAQDAPARTMDDAGAPSAGDQPPSSGAAQHAHADGAGAASPPSHASAVADARPDSPAGAAGSPPGQAAQASAPAPSPAAGPSPAPVLREAADHLEVHQGRAGAIVSWSVPADAAQVQVWRRDGPAWTPVTAAAAAGSVLDPAGEATSEYRLTWTTSALARDDLAAAVSGLPLVPALPPGSPVGAWLLALLGAGGAAFATVRAPGARHVPEARVSDEHQLLPTLVGVPGIDGEALERVCALGLRTVGQLRALDSDALAFWANVPAATVRRWHAALELLQWPALPAGAAHRLARAGAATLADVAAADPQRLWADLREGVGAPGPGLPGDMSELTAWVADARQAVGAVALVDTPAAPPPASGRLPAAPMLPA